VSNIRDACGITPYYKHLALSVWRLVDVIGRLFYYNIGMATTITIPDALAMEVSGNVIIGVPAIRYNGFKAKKYPAWGGGLANTGN
jgi:hypothetical protein